MAMFSHVGNAIFARYRILILSADASGKDGFGVLAGFGEFCVHTQHVILDDETYYIGLAKTGKIYVSKSKMTCALLSNNATSLAIASEFIIFTTTTHEAVFVPLTSLPSLLIKPDIQSSHESERAVLGPPKEIPAEWILRKVERGSKIVVAVPSSMSLVLQMPRGNLETINPRPLVMKVVEQDLDAYAFSFQSSMRWR
jgi:elongator complex protein 1